MPTKNPRINITLEEPAATYISNLAKQEHKSKARHLKFANHDKKHDKKSD